MIHEVSKDGNTSDDRQPTETTNPLATVSLCTVCGCINGVVSGRCPARDKSKFIRESVNLGMRVESRTSEEVRSGDWCECGRKAAAE